MRERYPLATPSYVIVGLVAVVLTATGFTLLHWHKDWTDQGCQLCHVRHLPSLYSRIAVAHSTAVISQQDWNSEHSGEELQAWVRCGSGRSPPTSISFTV